jgi:hypothetical protein
MGSEKVKELTGTREEGETSVRKDTWTSHGRVSNSVAEEDGAFGDHIT